MTRSAFKLVVFDWEGTLADTLGQILHTVLAEAKNLGFGEGSFALARQYVHWGLNRLIEKVFPHLSLTQQEQLVQGVQQAMLCRPGELCLIPGAKACLKALHKAHIFLAVASNKGQSSLDRAILAANLGELFITTRSPGQVPPKPCPQMLQEIMDFCGVTASETLMIGDSVADIEMAKQLGVRAVGVDFYHQQKQVLLDAGAERVFEDYDQVAAFLHVKEDSTS